MASDLGLHCLDDPFTGFQVRKGQAAEVSTWMGDPLFDFVDKPADTAFGESGGMGEVSC